MASPDKKQSRYVRRQVPEAPAGKQRWSWYGPGLLWMLSSVGSGSVLFTPRIGARYGYTLLWAALIIIFFQWVWIREVGRYTVVTGKSLLDGYMDVPGPRAWAVWFIFVPQLLAAVVTIAGMAALSGSALMTALPGNQVVYGTILIIGCVALVVTGKYKRVEFVSSCLAGILVLVAVATAIAVFPSPGKLLSGLVPRVPTNPDLYFILPWLGFILSGAAGIMWFSYWVTERGYGGDVMSTRTEPVDDVEESRRNRLTAWMRVMSRTAFIGVAGGGCVVISFLILGAEVLQPQGVVPEGIEVAKDLTQLFSDVWGPIGYWFLLSGIVIALLGTILADQDGWGRTFADATHLIAPRAAMEKWAWLENRETLKNMYAVVFTAILPLIVFLAVRNPVDILSVAGIVAAVHTPVIVYLTLYLNWRRLPQAFRPGKFISAVMIISGLFFAVVAVMYMMKQLTGQAG